MYAMKTICQVINCSYAYIQQHTVAHFSFSDLLEGTGYLERTFLFIGWYPAHLSESPSSYAIHLAYVLTFLFCYAVSISFIVRYIGKWLRTKTTFFNFEYAFSSKIFTTWRFTDLSMEASKIAKKCLANELLACKNELKFFREEKKRSNSEKRKLKLIRKIFHVLILFYIKVLLLFHVLTYSLKANHSWHNIWLLSWL